MMEEVGMIYFWLLFFIGIAAHLIFESKMGTLFLAEFRRKNTLALTMAIYLPGWFLIAVVFPILDRLGIISERIALNLTIFVLCAGGIATGVLIIKRKEILIWYDKPISNGIMAEISGWLLLISGVFLAILALAAITSGF